MHEESLHFLSEFSKQRLLVLGDLMLDEYLDGRVERISPEAPVPVVLHQKSRFVPGGAGNVICNLRSLDCRVEVIGLLGSDEGGLLLKERLHELGVQKSELALLESASRPTTRKTRILSGAHQLLRLDREDASPISPKEEEKIIQYLQEKIPNADALIISDYDKGLITPRIIRKSVAIAHKHNCLVAVDPQVTHFENYQKVDILTPNHHEAGRFLGRRLDSISDIEQAGHEILGRLDARNLLITRGENGMSLFHREQQRAIHIPTVAREVFDVTGAGDTVISVLTLALAAGANYEEAAVLANQAAGLVVAHIGAATVSVEDLRRASLSQTNPRSGESS